MSCRSSQHDVADIPDLIELKDHGIIFISLIAKSHPPVPQDYTRTSPRRFRSCLYLYQRYKWQIIVLLHGSSVHFAFLISDTFNPILWLLVQKFTQILQDYRSAVYSVFTNPAPFFWGRSWWAWGDTRLVPEHQVMDPNNGDHDMNYSSLQTSKVVCYLPSLPRRIGTESDPVVALCCDTDKRKSFSLN